MSYLRRVLCLASALFAAALMDPTAGAQQPAGQQTGASPDVHTRNPHGPLPASCEACHTATAWTPMRARPEFNHNTQTAYALRGMHANVACKGCHVSQVFKNTSHDCASCHADLAVFTPSATICVLATICSGVSPLPNRSPNPRLRL